MTEKHYRDDLPPIPERLLKLPVERGYPVPWFVAEVDGNYDFRLVDASKYVPAVKERRCWICGEVLGSSFAFTIGPMCAINRTISEPPSHRECAEFSIKACPFLNQQQTRRREGGLPEGVTDPAGVALKRQPGVICLWITNSYQIFRVDGGSLFRIAEPQQVFWFREGRPATRAEVLESIDSGLPSLREMAEMEGPRAMRQLNAFIERAHKLVPSDGPLSKRNLFASAAR